MTRERAGWRRVVWLLGAPLRFVLIAVLRGYQRYVSPLFAPSCRYHPCCSSYAITAIRRHGAAKGLLLTVARLIRCNPWSAGGVDPVPRRGRWRSPVLPDGTVRRPRQTGAAAVAARTHRA